MIPGSQASETFKKPTETIPSEPENHRSTIKERSLVWSFLVCIHNLTGTANTQVMVRD